MSLTLDQMKAVTHEFHNNLNNRDFDKQFALVTSDVEFHKNGEVIKGAENFVDALRGITAVFADAVITDQEAYAEGNVAVVRYILSGSLTGSITFPDGTSASKTHKAFKYNSVEFFEFDKDGKVCEIRQVNDSGLTPYTVEAQVK